MSLSFETLAAANKYTDDSLAGSGAVAGVPCQIQSITAITGGHRVTYLWEDNNGVSHTSTMDVMNGIDGQDGKGIQSVAVNAENHLIITYSDGTTSDAGEIEIHSAVDSVNGKTGAVTLDAEDVGALPDDTPIPSKTSDLTNDSGFITKVVNDLVNYYLKSETYSKTEVDDIVTAIKNSRFEVVATLPTTNIKTNVIYLVPKSPSQTSNVKDEYINLDGTTSGWEKIGDTEIDLSDYVTTSDLSTALADYTTTSDLTTLLAAKADKSTVDGILDGTDIDSFADVETALANKADVSDLEDERDMRYLYNCKNLLNAMTSPQTSKDVVFTPNDKGEITCSGSVSITPSYVPAIPIDQSALVVGEKYILSGLPDDSTNCYIKIYQSDGYVEINGATKTRMITYDGTNIKSWDCGVRTVGTDATGKVFKPMLCLKSDYDNDPTYVPPANTNQYLSAKKADWSAVNALYNDVSGTKNILESVGANSTTIRDVLFIKNSDGSVTASGTQDGTGGGSYYHVNDYIYGDGKKYILTGCPEGGSRTTYRIYLYDNTTGSTGEVATDSGSGSSATLISGHTYICNIHIGPSQTVSDLTFHPMLRLASIQDDTYVPYAKTNQQLTEDSIDWDNFSELGAVNMLDFTHASEVRKGYTFTNTDGVVTVTGSRASGETGNADHYVNITLTKGTYKVSGCPSGGSDDTWRLLVNINDGAKYAFDYGDGAVFTLTEESSLRVYCTIMANYSDTVNLTFYPMITVASYNGDYVPYAKTNRELTEKIDIVGNLFTTTTKVVDNITHNIATTVATLGNLPIGTYVVSGQFNSDSAMNGGGLVQFASSGVIQNGATCSTITNQGFKANAGLTGIFNVTNATNQINLQIYTANADLTVASARLAAIRIA